MEEHGDPGAQVVVEFGEDAFGRRLRRPVLAPGRPQHRAQAEALGCEETGVGERAERRAVPARHLTGGVGHGVDAAQDVVTDPAGRTEELGAVVIAVGRHFVAGRCHLGGDAWMGIGVHAEHEERGPHPQAVELVEEGGCRRRVRPVVEREGDVVG